MLFVWGSSASGSLLGVMNGDLMVVCFYYSSVSLSDNYVPNFIAFMRVAIFLVILIPTTGAFHSSFWRDWVWC